MKKISDMILKVEELLAGIMLVMIAILVFLSAVARTIGMPINWAQDVSLLAFGWLTFIGADIIIKNNSLIRIDMLANKLPKFIQKVLMLIFDVMMLTFLLILIVYGFMLVSQSWNRTFNTLKLSYAWCTLAVPVGSFFMFLSMIGKFWNDIRRPMKEWGAV
ncbi:TRAP transporter small permease [Lacrimispora sp. 210928-DFI.3.58]|uniref:TRAP transporter small permease n=1 Tax=Lacrimispora sp. 210928-DFI.3.58 TaxID=2883214 RepID=UPI0015B40483|nr:TRAP transporter small permease [Lacrimispora sp. 210928-DFI.3.58]MCB7318472.1 TRAP transporter small permease [Lacrimispora sp. 210928-DFI.3.58]